MKLVIDLDKQLAAQHYLETGEESEHLSKTDIKCLNIGTLELADLEHIKKYGRPVIGQIYPGNEETLYGRNLFEAVYKLPNIDEIIEYINQ